MKRINLTFSGDPELILPKVGTLAKLIVSDGIVYEGTIVVDWVDDGQAYGHLENAHLVPQE